jgi:hypothetical protein
MSANLRRGIRGLIFIMVLLCMIALAAGQGYCDLELNKTHIPVLIKTPSINLSPNPINVGQTLTITGSNFNKTPYPGDTYPMVVISASDPSGDVGIAYGKILTDGSFKIEFYVNPNATPGMIPLYGIDKWGHKSQTVNLVVIPAATPTPTQIVQGTATPQAMATLSPTVIPAGTPDTTAPVTTLNLAGIKGADGIFTSNVVCTLTAEDNGSGVNATLYSFDGTNWTPYTGPFTIVTPGNTSVFYRSTDKANNQEITKAEAIAIKGSASVATGTGLCMAVILPLLIVGFVSYTVKKGKSK